MRTGQFVAIIVFAFLITNCSPSRKAGTSAASEVTAGTTFKKLFIEVATVDIDVRTKLEDALSEAAASQGYAAVKSYVLIPFSLKDLKLPSKEEIESKVKESNADAILLVTLHRKGESIQRTPGTFKEANEQLGAGLLSGILNKSGEVKKVPGVDNPGSIAYNKGGFILQSNLYGVPGGENVFSGKSEAVDVSLADDIKKASSSLISQLKKKK